MLEQELAKEYENILLGKKKNYSSAFFTANAKESSQKNALIVMKYVFEKFLNWTPKDVEKCLTWDIISLMKIDALVKHIQFPGELNPKTDLWYIAHLLYPKAVPFNGIKKTLYIYKSILDKKLYRYPKNFWDGQEGLDRAKLCLRYALQNVLIFHDMEDVYSSFSKNGLKLIKEIHLMIPFELFYDSPIDYLHDALNSRQQDEFLYHYYKFREELLSLDIPEIKQKEKRSVS